MSKSPTKKQPPFAWYGGKRRMAAKLIPLFPEHQIYVEVFGGSGAVLFAKPPSNLEIFNDLHSGVVHFYRALQDPKRATKIREMLALMPHSREEFYACRDDWEAEEDEIKKAYKWLYSIVHSFSSIGDTFAVSRDKNHLSNSTNPGTSIHTACYRMKKVVIENLDFRRLIPLYDTPNTFFYCDPPYVLTARTTGKDYKHEMTQQDHEELITLLLSVKGKVMLSGYASSVYDPLISVGWQKREFKVTLGASRKSLMAWKDIDRTEVIWMNYSPPEGI
jgi:DNA adenine methylase